MGPGVVWLAIQHKWKTGWPPALLRIGQVVTSAVSAVMLRTEAVVLAVLIRSGDPSRRSVNGDVIVVYNRDPYDNGL